MHKTPAAIFSLTKPRYIFGGGLFDKMKEGEILQYTLCPIQSCIKLCQHNKTKKQRKTAINHERNSFVLDEKGVKCKMAAQHQANLFHCG